MIVVGVFAFTTWKAAAQTVQSAAAPAVFLTSPVSTAVELVKALAWPLVVLLIAVVFRRPLALFVSAMGSRITKLSLFKAELTLVPATAATTTPLLDDIRTATNSAMISDSARTMLDQVQSTPPADFALIALGDGKQWLTARLYISAVRMARSGGVNVFVCVERAANPESRTVTFPAV